MFAIPKAILEALSLKPNQQVGLTITDGNLVITPRTKPKYTLAELLAQCDPNAPMSEEDFAWENSPPMGEEVI